MTQTVLGPKGSPRRRWTLLLPLTLALVVGLFYAAGAQAVHDDGLFELDKNATNNLNTSKIGVLQANISGTDDPIVICETTAFNGTPAAVPFNIQIEAEQMTVDARTVVAGGAGGCSTKASYEVTRVGGVAHQKADDVTLFVTATKDGPDWNLVHQQITLDADDLGNDDKCTALGLLECSYVNDGEGQSIFDQGGSKDHEIITNWRHKSGSVSDKSNILNAYAAKDVDGSGHQILYFGADRLAVDGSTDAGFWFFRNEVIANPDGTFTGTHAGSLQTPGDILILTTFTQGGATNNVRVFRWVGSGGNESGSIQGPDATFGDCVPGSANDNGCATVNDTSILVPWSYQGKGEPVGGWVPAGGLLEGGVDLTALNLDGCFSSFLAETRSSPSVPAILEDFTLGKFEACGSTLTTTPGDGTTSGTALTDTNANTIPDISIGTGTVAVKDRASLSVTGISTWSGTLQFFICGPIASPTLCDSGGVSAGAAAAVSNSTTQPILSPAVNLTSAGRYCWRAVFTSSTTGVPNATDSSSGECFEVLPVTPALNTEAVLNSNGDAIPAGYKFPFGSSVYDTATLSGAAKEPGSNGPAAYPTINATNGAYAGTIEFTLKGPDGGTPTCSTTTASGTGTNPQTVNVDTTTGNKKYGPVGFQPGSPGAFHWVAVYTNTGSLNNANSVTHNADCSDSDEAVTVEQIPTNIKTKQSWFPNDTATISAASGNLGDSGTVDFYLYGSSDCSTAVLYSERVTLGTGLGTSAEVSTSNYTGSTAGKPGGGTVTPFAVTTGYADASASVKSPFAWKIVYTPADTAHTGKQSACNAERFSITYTNDNGPGTNLP